MPKAVGDGYRAFPTVPLDFVFEEWMNLHAALWHAQLTERPLAPLEIYKLLIGATGHTLGNVREALQDVLTQMSDEEVKEEDDDAEIPLERALGTTLWAVTLESYLLAEAIRRCRDYSEAFYARFHAARGHRKNRQYPRAISKLERAVTLHPHRAALRDMLLEPLHPPGTVRGRHQALPGDARASLGIGSTRPRPATTWPTASWKWAARCPKRWS